MEIKTQEGKIPSKYKVEKISNRELRVTSTDVNRCSVACVLSDDNLTWEVDHVDNFDMNRSKKSFSIHRLNLIEHHNVIRNISDVILRNWTINVENLTDRKFYKKQNKIKAWAVGNVGKAISKRISPILKEIESQHNPLALSIQKAVFATSGKIPYIITTPEFYQKADKYYLKDIINYKAAAHSVWFSEADGDLENILYPDSNSYLENIVYRLNWRDLYKYNFTDGYSSLDKMLSNFPSRIPFFLLKEIHNIKFERPIYDRLELLFILGCSMNHNWTRLPTQTQHIIQHCTNDEIKRCRKRYERYLRTKFPLRKSLNIVSMSSFLMDYFGIGDLIPEIARGNICGIMDRSIDYHHDLEGNVSRGKCSLDENQLTAVPRIPLPTNPHITFLKTVHDVIEEGILLKHCVGSYAQKAVCGKSHLFHIDYMGEMATAEVCPHTGMVVQSHGIRNQDNVASKYGYRELLKWAEGFRPN